MNTEDALICDFCGEVKHEIHTRERLVGRTGIMVTEHVCSTCLWTGIFLDNKTNAKEDS